MSVFALVIVTFNRSKLLSKCLESVLSGTKLPDHIYVINNASTDDTNSVMQRYVYNYANRITVINLPKNLGGAGGFEVGTRIAFENGASFIGLLDDDVVLYKDCLEVVFEHFSHGKDCMIAVREDLKGNLVEYGALHVDYSNPFRANPKVSSVAEEFASVSNLPDILEVSTGAFEGFFFSAEVVKKVGFPNKEFFIFGDDTDYSLRIRKTGYKIYAIKSARVIRQLAFQRYRDKQSQWKQYYRWRNFFTLHFVYGENFLVRFKPFLLTGVLCCMNIFKKDALNYFQVLKDSLELEKSLKSKKQF